MKVLIFFREKFDLFLIVFFSNELIGDPGWKKNKSFLELSEDTHLQILISFGLSKLNNLIFIWVDTCLIQEH